MGVAFEDVEALWKATTSSNFNGEMKAKRPFKSKDQLLFHVGKTFSESAGPYFMFTTFIGLFLFVLPSCYYAVFRSPFINVQPQDSVLGYLAKSAMQ